MSFKSERFLVEAIEQCHLHKIIICLKHGHRVSIVNDLGQNLLVHLLKQENVRHPSFAKRRFRIFQFLIRQGNLNVHHFDSLNKNIFNWATNLNRTDEALYLLRAYHGDIDILARDQSGLCSLHYAIEHGNEELVHAIVDYLLRYRIRFDIRDNQNNTPEELARKLGHEKIADYLFETSQATIFMSRELPFHQLRTMTSKSKLTKSSSTTVSSSTSSSLFESSEFLLNLIESKIETAKILNDWKTVAALRTYKRSSTGRKINHLPRPTLQTDHSIIEPSSVSAFPPIKLPPSSRGQSAQMLHLIQPQISSSYRQPFIPQYQRAAVPTVSLLPSTVTNRKMSVVSSRRMSSVLSFRKRDSNASQIGLSTTQDGPNRLPLPSSTKQHRQSIVSSRQSDTEALAKLRAKHLITAHN